MKKLFTNDKFFLLMTVFAIVGCVGYAVPAYFLFDYYTYELALAQLFRAGCVVALFVSYQRHGKNVMKGMMGALLAMQVVDALLYLPDIYLPIEYVCVPLFAIFSVLLFVNHFVINSEHKANPRMIKTNQILVVLLFVFDLIWTMAWIVVEPTFINIVLGLADILAYLGLTTSVVCVESRLDAYRLDREAAGWTEEKGYPEGYVHEYEKK